MSVSVDGKTKQVTSPRDDGFENIFNRSQFHFRDIPATDEWKEKAAYLKLTTRIESLAGIGKWTKCSESCEVFLYVWTPRRTQKLWSTVLVSTIQSKKPLLDKWDVYTLIEAGMDVDIPNESGVTPLMAASKNGDFPLVRTLVLKGANASAKDKKGRTAWNYTTNSDIRGILAAHGGR
jgi:hypothetical protein